MENKRQYIFLPRDDQATATERQVPRVATLLLFGSVTGVRKSLSAFTQTFNSET